MTLKFSGPETILERVYSAEFKELVGHIEECLKSAKMETYDGETFVQVSLELATHHTLYEKYSHRAPYTIPFDEFMEEMVIKHYEAAGWHRVQEYHIDTLRFYFKRPQ